VLTGMKACDVLPVTLPKDFKGGRRFSTPRARCVTQANRILASAYMAGRYRDVSACELFLTGESFEGNSFFNPADCPKGALGMEKICDNAPPEYKSYCRGVFPAKLSECGDSELCRINYDINAAMKTDNPALCPAEQRVLCDAFISKSQAPCGALAAQVSAQYCKALGGLKKREETLAAAEEKKEAERRKKQEEKELSEVNKTVRKVLKKE
jgi:hypothetical protein